MTLVFIPLRGGWRGYCGRLPISRPNVCWVRRGEEEPSAPTTPYEGELKIRTSGRDESNSKELSKKRLVGKKKKRH